MARARAVMLVFVAFLSTRAWSWEGGIPSDGVDWGLSDYTVTALPLPADASTPIASALAINDDGMIVGQYTAVVAGVPRTRPLRWVDRQPEALVGNVVTVLADGTEVQGALIGGAAIGVSEDGTVVGSVSTTNAANFGTWAALWDDDERKWRTLPRPAGATGASPTAIDDEGRVVGNSPRGAWLWSGGEAEYLPIPGPDDLCTARGMNRVGMVTGSCLDGDIENGPLNGRGVGHAVVWSRGEVVQLADVGAHLNVAYAINDLGYVVGEGGEYDGNDVRKPFRGHAAAWSVRRPDDAASFAEFTPAPWPLPPSVARSVNNFGEVVGREDWSVPGLPRFALPTLWLTRVGQRIVLPDLGGTDALPVDINNRGQAVGTCTIPDGKRLPCVWEVDVSPDPEPIPEWNLSVTVTALDLPADASSADDAFAVALDDGGTIVGRYQVRIDGVPYLRPVRWIDRQPEALDGRVVTALADGHEVSDELRSGWASDVGEDGAVVGTVSTSNPADGASRAALWEDEANEWRTIPRPAGATWASATAIADGGLVAGNSSGGAWLWSGGEAEYLTTPGPDDTCEAWGMNRTGMVTGVCYDGDIESGPLNGRGVAHAVVWWRREVVQLADVGAHDTTGFAINNLGFAVGLGGEYANDNANEPFLGRAAGWSVHEPDRAVILDEWNPGSATGVNDFGDVVGFHGFLGPSGYQRPALWQTRFGRSYTLPPLNGWDASASDVNNRRQVVGWSAGGQVRVPVVWEYGEPSSGGLSEF